MGDQQELPMATASDLARDDVVKPGMLAIKVLEAKDLADGTRFGPIDAYIKFSVLSTKASGDVSELNVASGVAVDGGSSPTWIRAAEVHLTVDPSMVDTDVQISAWAKDRFDDDLLCRGSCPVRQLSEYRKPEQIWVPLSNGDYTGGSVKLEITYVATHPEHLFFVGGKSFDWESTGGLVERYNPVEDEWDAEVASLPSQTRDSAAAANLNGMIYVAGGLTPRPSNTVECYDILRDSWTTVASMQVARHGLAMVAVGGYLYALGGCTDSEGNGTTSVERYCAESDTWSEMAPMGTERRKGCAAATLDDGCIYVMGGEEMDVDAVPPRREVTALFERYDPATNTWEQLPSMPTARGSLAAVGLDGAIYAGGGSGAGEDNMDTAAYDVVERFDPLTNEWSTMAPLCCGKSKLCMAVIGGRVYAAGGYSYIQDECRDEFYDSVEVYDPVHDAWQAVAPLAVPRCLGCVSVGSS